MNKTIIYLIRHSEQLKIKGIKNIEENEQISNEKIILSVLGEKNAEELANFKELSDIDILWSSNYVRAISTSKYIADKNNIDINIDDKLNERKIGDLSSLKKLGEDRKYTFTEEQLLDENLKNIGGESRLEVSIRMNDVLNKILCENKGKKIAIVSHGAAIKFLLMNWCKLNEEVQLVYEDKVVLNLKSPSAIKLEFIENELEDLSIVL